MISAIFKAGVGPPGAVLVIGLCISGCSDASGTLSLVPSELRKISGDGQSGVAGSSLSAPLIIRVSDTNGNPVAGVRVTWTVPTGGGSLTPSTANTGSDGQAAATWRLGTLAGTQTAQADVDKLTSAIFTATGTAGAAAKIDKLSGDGQTVAAGSSLAAPLVIRVVDANENAVAGVSVTWTVTGGGGQLIPSSSHTGNDGQASALWRLGSKAGANTAIAAFAGSGGVAFSAMGKAGAPAKVEKLSGDSQLGAGGASLTAPLVVRVLDAYDNDVAGVSVTWTVTAGGGSIAPASANTGTDGRAIAAWTLGPARGRQSAMASVQTDIHADFTAVADVRLPLDQISLSYAGGCAVAFDAKGYCWGWNNKGQLGDGTTTDHYIPAPLASTERWKAISLSTWHACGIATSNTVYCWGMGWIDAYVQLDTTRDILVPTPIVVDGIEALPIVSVGTSFDYSCALGANGRPYCWGNHWVDWRGNGPKLVRPVELFSESGQRMTFSSLSVGALHACALDSSGRAHCWGGYANGELGDGVAPAPTFRYRWFTRPVLGDLSFSMIRSGGGHTCALTVDGTAYCWGANSTGQLGDGSTLARTQPVRVATQLRFREIAPGTDHTCALTHEGRAYCWGDNTFGQLGDGTGGGPYGTRVRTSPTAVQTNLVFERISAASSMSLSCAIDAAGQGYCWGSNQSGGVGDGVAGIGMFRTLPTPIKYP